MISLDASARVVSACPEVCDFFALPANQLFELETDTIFFTGDYIIVRYKKHRLFALALAGSFRTTLGDLPRESCAVLARAVPIESE